MKPIDYTTRAKDKSQSPKASGKNKKPSAMRDKKAPVQGGVVAKGSTILLKVENKNIEKQKTPEADPEMTQRDSES